MKRSRANTFLTPFIVILGLAAAAAISATGGSRPPLPPGYEDSDLELQGKRLKGFALGFEGLLADWYWVRSLQYVGNKIVRSDAETLNIEDLSSLDPRLLYPLLDNATDLDPKFIAAYSYGATVLPAIDREAAIRLTEKGIANNRENWRLYQYLGYIYWRMKEFDKAAEVYSRGAALPGAPEFMPLMAAAMKTQGGSRETARVIYNQILSEAQDEGSRLSARLRILELDSLDERDAIKEAIEQFRKRIGRCPANWAELIPTLRTIPSPTLRVDESNNLVDPTGAPYILDRELCVAKIDGTRSKIPQ